MRGLRLGLGLTGSPAAAAVPVPLALFAGGASGAWYDVQDLSTMFQDSAGTTAAAVDSPVGLIREKSGNGLHMLSSGSTRPTLRKSGSLYYLETAGTEYMASALSYTLGQPNYIIAAFSRTRMCLSFVNGMSASLSTPE